MLFSGSSHKRDEIKGLQTERQIALFRQREAAKRERAERREAEARVRHSNFELIQRVVLLACAIVIGLGIAVGSANNPDVLKLAMGGGGVWGVMVATLYGLSARRELPK